MHVKIVICYVSLQYCVFGHLVHLPHDNYTHLMVILYYHYIFYTCTSLLCTHVYITDCGCMYNDESVYNYYILQNFRVEASWMDVHSKHPQLSTTNRIMDVYTRSISATLGVCIYTCS